MKVLFGIGNPLRMDDGIGIYVSSRLEGPDWKAFDCGTVPENFTSIVRRSHPEILVLVDAAEMGLRPGTFRIVPKERIADVSIGTHHLPLTHLIEFLSDAADRILFIGIQPAVVADGEGLSDDVRRAADLLVELLKKEDFGALETL